MAARGLETSEARSHPPPRFHGGARNVTRRQERLSRPPRPNTSGLVPAESLTLADIVRRELLQVPRF